jgi:hypothetical protein
MTETPECIEGRLIDLIDADLSDLTSIDPALLAESLLYALRCVGGPGEAIAGFQTSAECGD